MRADWLRPSSTPQAKLLDMARRLTQTLHSGPPTTSVVMMISTARRPEDVLVRDGKLSAAQHLTARHRPHTTTVNTAETSDMMTDSARLQCKEDVMYSIITRPSMRPATTATDHWLTHRRSPAATALPGLAASDASCCPLSLTCTHQATYSNLCHTVNFPNNN